MSDKNWLQNTDADHDEYIHKWKYTKDVYTGEYSDTKNVKEYLHKRAFFEKDKAYDLRIAGVDPDLSLFTIISSIVGQAMSTEEDDKYTFEDDGFKQILEEKLWDNIDGDGTSYPVFWKGYASKQLVYQWMYVFVEGITTVEEEGTERVAQEARIKLITPDMVLAKGDGWMKVKHSVMTGTDDPSKEQEMVDQYTIYHMEGWTRYQDEEGTPVHDRRRDRITSLPTTP